MPSSIAIIATSETMLKTDTTFHQMNYWQSASVGQQVQLDLLDHRTELEFCPMCEALHTGRLR